MDKESLGKILFGFFIGCALSIFVAIAVDVYTDYVIDEIVSTNDGVESETETIGYNFWDDYEISYVYDPLSLLWQNKTKNLNDVGYINGEEISELRHTDSILINNISFREYALCLKVIPDNFTQKHYYYNHTETKHNENIIIGEQEYHEITTYHLILYLNTSNCEELKKILI
ncbi:hypothetical protein KAU33_04065 [Candidatus Dependentiae bacterium]|nr:hypothetical protein [Candidatus Dependentiae bacterium]